MTDNCTLKCEIQYDDLVKILKAFDCQEDASVVADYLTENIDYTLDLSNYLWNILPFFVQTFESKIDAIEYCKDNYDETYWENCKIYECEDGCTYFEGC